MLLIRADAATQIGAGHVMRCIALAQAWREAGGTAMFATATDAPGIRERVGDEGFETVRLAGDAGSDADADATVRLARDSDARWVVVDGYHFRAPYRRHVRAAGLRVLYVDDCGDIGPYRVDVVLNQNAYACEAMYGERDADTQLLLGSRYTLLREEFRALRERRHEVSAIARRILVTIGAGDADNVTATVLAALCRLGERDLEAVVLVGGANPHYEALCRQARSVPFGVRVERNRSAVAERMAWADVAVSAGGSTCWELAFMGLPACVVTVADNQVPIVEYLTRMGVVADLGWSCELTEEGLTHTLGKLIQDEPRRARMREQGRSLVDGHGAARVVEAMDGNRKR